MSGIAPASFLLTEQLFRNFAKRPALRLGNPLRIPIRRSGFERIYAVQPQLAVFTGASPSGCERHIGVGAYPHVSPFAVELIAEHPRFAPLPETRRYNPPPSCSTAGPLALVTSIAVSLPMRAIASPLPKWGNEDQSPVLSPILGEIVRYGEIQRKTARPQKAMRLGQPCDSVRRPEITVCPIGLHDAEPE